LEQSSLGIAAGGPVCLLQHFPDAPHCFKKISRWRARSAQPPHLRNEWRVIRRRRLRKRPVQKGPLFPICIRNFWQTFRKPQIPSQSRNRFRAANLQHLEERIGGGKDCDASRRAATARPIGRRANARAHKKKKNPLPVRRGGNQQRAQPTI
jgi:hypothetical protein